jgi:hypothetical protein
MMKPAMKDSSATALLALAALFLAPGMLILAPDGRLFFLVLAGLASAVVAIAGPSREKRIAACIGLLLAAALAIPTWPESRSHFDSWKKHTSRPVEQRSKQEDPLLFPAPGSPWILPDAFHTLHAKGDVCLHRPVPAQNRMPISLSPG